VPQRADDRAVEGPQVADHILPDLLAPGLRVVFCGTAAGDESARIGAPYAGPGNRFWWVLHEVGLTPRTLRPLEFRELLGLGIGLTDVAKHAIGRDSALGPPDFDGAAVIDKTERFAPRVLAFVGKRAALEVLGRKPGGYGEQDVTVGVSRVWILPSTSGAARGSWDIGPWQGLAAVISDERRPGSPRTSWRPPRSAVQSRTPRGRG
jgi:TDG/mug DNA glycosylase family protein